MSTTSQLIILHRQILRNLERRQLATNLTTIERLDENYYKLMDECKAMDPGPSIGKDVTVYDEINKTIDEHGGPYAPQPLFI